MSNATATLAGHTVTQARVHLPSWGVWWAEAALDEEIQLAGPAALIVADLILIGTVISGGPGPKGRSRYRIAGGAGGWGKSIDAKSYANDAGVKASTVITDAASACGERVDATTLPETRLGPAFVREAGPAARVLEQVTPANWYVGEDGITRIGARPVEPLTITVEVGRVDRACGVVELASDSIAQIVPGVQVEGLTAVDVLHEVTPGAIRSVLWTSGVAPASRELIALRRLIAQLDPNSRYRGIYEYRVVSQQAERVNLQPIRVSVGMPDLQRVSVRPGVSGARADLALGSRVLVGFIEADPARPIVVGFEDADGGGFLPQKLELDSTNELDVGETAVVTKLANGTLAVARQTDAVIAGGFSGTIVGPCSLRVRCG